MNKAVIFDMDGVIFDTERLIFEKWQEIAKKYGYDKEVIGNVFKACIGTNREKTRQIVKERLGADFPYDTFREEASQLFYKNVEKDRMPIKTGVKELLEYLKTTGVKIGLASSTRKEVVEKELTDANLLVYFEVVIGGDMVLHSKPEPDIFLKCLEELGVKPEKTYIIEDSYNGIRAAKKSGAIPIMVPDMLEENDEMRQLSKVILPSLIEVKKFLEEVF